MKPELHQDAKQRLRAQRTRRTAWLIAALAALVYFGFIAMAIHNAV